MEALLPYIKRQTPIPPRTMLEAFNQAQDSQSDSKRRRIANEIIAEAGDYLPFWLLLPMIEAEISDEEVLGIIAERKAFIERASSLMPSLLSLFGASDASVLRSCLIRIYDCCYDFRIVRRAPHEKTVRKEIVSGLRTLREQIASLDARLENIGKHIEHDFDFHLDAVSKVRKEPRQPLVGFYNSFREELSCLSFITNVLLYKEGRGSGAIVLTDNKAKTHIVECVYSTSIRHDDPSAADCPQFVTTPGSKFSVACSLLYELASGESDVSLAGAINRFARSELRRRIDEDEKETRWENSDEGMLARESENFADVRGTLKALDEEKKFWEEMLASENWNDSQMVQFGIRLKHIDIQVEAASVTHGPFLVWADHISERERAESWRRFQERDAEDLQAAIERGRRRRFQRRS